jgi:hypothetical protein
MGSGAFSPPGEPCSGLHPGLATPIQSLSGRYTQGAPLATAAQRLQLSARVGSDHERCWRHRIPERELSTGSRCAARKRCHPACRGSVQGRPPLGGAAGLAIKAGSGATTPLGFVSLTAPSLSSVSLVPIIYDFLGC